MKGRLRPTNKIFTESNSVNNRFINDSVIEQYDSYVSKLLKDCNTWKVIALFSLIMLIISLCVLGKANSLPRTELVVIGVNDLGQAKYYGKTSGFSYDGYVDMHENIIRDILTTFIQNTYTISADSDLMYQNFVDCLYFLPYEKRKNYNLEIKQTDPFSLVGRFKQTIEIETIICISEKTYQVDWYNIETDMSGYREKRYKKRGLFTMQQLSAEQYNKLTEEERTKNPTGTYIIDYNIVDVKEK